MKKNSIRKKILMNFFINNGATLVNFFLSLYIARIVLASEIGIFSIAAVLVGFAHVFRDFGVASFIRSQKELTPQLLRASMGVMICSSWTFALVVFSTSSFAAEYYGQPGIEAVMRVLALGFLFIPIGSIPQAVLSRSLDVKIQAIVTVISVSVYAVTCITLAKMGYSYMSFAWANFANIAVSAIAYSFLRPEGIPWLPSFAEWRSVVNFGAGTMLTNSIRAIDSALPDLILGKLANAHSVGIFSRANSTVNMVSYIIAPTMNFFALPHLAKIHHEGKKIAHEIKRVVTYLTGIVWPVLAVVAVLPDDIIVFLYGKNWIECADVIPSLCAVCALQLTFSVFQPAFTGIGRPYLIAMPLVVSVFAKGMIAVFFFDGTLQSFGKAYLIGEILSMPLYFLLIRKIIGLSLVDWMEAVWPSAALAVFSYGSMFLLYPYLSYFDHLLFRLISAATFFLTIWIASVMLLKHPLSSELMRVRRPFANRTISAKKAPLAD